MHCNDTDKLLDDYIDGTLADTDRAAIDAHVETCARCQGEVDNAVALRDRLEAYGAALPAPDADFFDRALATATARSQRESQRRSWLTGFGTAVAAGLVVWLVAITAFETPTVDTSLPTVTMALAEPRTVNLVFSSADDLTDATLTVMLPEGVEISGFEGQREITWLTSLKKGKNVLPLMLIGTTPSTGELLATLKHGADDRTFRLRIDVS